ncbi:hypothetical protein BCT30_06850 [Enterovibrio norvegicus]|uniref:glycoside hydrolase family 18 protein n=1 Tax=Enterovibrio norvegicus TaxID=188144 RepID=UPI000C83B779|nr:glycosyl hydrolase family 18 protein [Enterovibrio norvegicus]MCC4797221.1 hypothetical protein [Enterovibrio norvegicus]PMI26951.1 hypothetical protein BCU47_03115 [Enterovibrio norvegicus]PMI40070.1 hypothetical protein BCU46_05635 [Enterovibrio norvegicus]PMN56171.1 hypothetical protein BCT30_06850 [Enterovibrio norvegicus]TKF08692.1 hypothetical protein FCV66_22505 [Enterovibrio norvegicus]
MKIMTQSLITLGLMISSTCLAQSLPKDHDFFSGEFGRYQQNSGKVVGTYIGNWIEPSEVSKINGNNVTHLIYAFVETCGDKQRAVLNEVCDKLEDNQLAVNDSTVDTTFITQFSRLKQRYPDLKILLSIGGGGRSATFEQVTSNKENSQVFIQSTLDYLAKYPVFDGIDIDWEYPLTHEQGAAFATLMKDLRVGLDQLGVEQGRNYINSTAVNTIDYLTQFVDYTQVAPSTDLIFMMTYDFYGSWTEKNIGHHTNLKTHPNNTEQGYGHSVDAAVNKFLSFGIPADKLVIGVAKYARGWQGVSEHENGGPFGTATSELYPNSIEEAGVMTYATLYDTVLGKKGQGKDGFEIRYDAKCECHYAWRDKDSTLITFDHPIDVYQKAQYAVKRNLAGVFSWAYQQDNGDLLNAMNVGIGNQVETK